MKTFFTVLKNDYLRTVPRVVPLIFVTAFTLLSIVLGVHMTGVQQVKGHVAIISENSEAAIPQSTKQLDIKVVTEKPPYSALVEQKYDAYVTIDANGNYSVETLLSEDYKNMILLLLENPNAQIGDIKAARGVGVNIIGFMMMFMLMISFGNLFVFADDKEQGQLKRVATTPASFGAYLAAHVVYCLSILLPEYLLLVILKLFGSNIGFSLPQYAGLMLILGLMGISFGLLLHTFIHKPDNANMLGNSVTILTSILAGSFYSFTKNNTVLEKITMVLPQKDFMDFALYMQNGEAAKHIWPMAYVAAFILVLFVLSCVVLRSMYVKKV